MVALSFLETLTSLHLMYGHSSTKIVVEPIVLSVYLYNFVALFITVCLFPTANNTLHCCKSSAPTVWLRNFMHALAEGNDTAGKPKWRRLVGLLARDAAPSVSGIG
jgi:hypothetical protein